MTEDHKARAATREIVTEDHKARAVIRETDHRARAVTRETDHRARVVIRETDHRARAAIRATVMEDHRVAAIRETVTEDHRARAATREIVMEDHKVQAEEMEEMAELRQDPLILQSRQSLPATAQQRITIRMTDLIKETKMMIA